MPDEIQRVESVVLHLSEAVNRFATSSDRLTEALRQSPHGGTGNSQITIQAGGAAVWFCVLFCAISLTAVVTGLFQLSEARADIREIRQENQTMRDYLSAIYAQAPHLRPKED